VAGTEHGRASVRGYGRYNMERGLNPGAGHMDEPLKRRLLKSP
jgi:hypothetical protein